MRFFFGDDSAVQGRREDMGRLVGFGGILLREGALEDVEEGAAGVLSGFGIPSTTEFKWSLPSDNWIRNNLTAAQQEELRRKLLEVLHDAETRAIVAAIDTARTYFDRDRAERECVMYVFERVTTYLRGEPCTIVADRPGGGRREEDDFLEWFWERVREGTDFVNPDTVRHVDTSPSRLSRHLQLADLVTGITTAMVAGEVRYAPPLFSDFVQPMFITNYRGVVGGTGLKLFPDDLVNLYHWVLGERSYSRGASGIPLPSNGYPYFESDGIHSSEA